MGTCHPVIIAILCKPLPITTFTIKQTKSNLILLITLFVQHREQSTDGDFSNGMNGNFAFHTLA